MLVAILMPRSRHHNSTSASFPRLYTEAIAINADTARGKVVLSGRTASAVKRDFARQIARNTTGRGKKVKE